MAELVVRVSKHGVDPPHLDGDIISYFSDADIRARSKGYKPNPAMLKKYLMLGFTGDPSRYTVPEYIVEVRDIKLGEASEPIAIYHEDDLSESVINDESMDLTHVLVRVCRYCVVWRNYVPRTRHADILDKTIAVDIAKDVILTPQNMVMKPKWKV